MKQLIILGFIAVVLGVGGSGFAEAPAADAMEFFGYTGYESRQLSLRADFTYAARWTDDVSRGGSASGTWELVGNEIRLTPTKEEGNAMRGGPMRILVLKEGKGYKALFLKQEEAPDSTERKIPLYLQEKKLGNPPATIPVPTSPVPGAGKEA